MNALIPPPSSPFDALKRFDDDGEFWFARELMEPLGYATWENFAESIRRARAACRNAGESVELNFRDTTKNSTGRGRPAADVRLTRFAAYLVAMNGDPDKSEIASAQAYFAIKTREAEIGAVGSQAALTVDPHTRMLQRVELTAARLSVLAIPGLHLDPRWVAAKSQELAAIALGEQPPALGESFMTVSDYLDEKGLTAGQQRRAAGVFGGALKDAYRAVHKREPKLIPRFVNGKDRMVGGYTEADRGLFDQVWAARDWQSFVERGK